MDCLCPCLVEAFQFVVEDYKLTSISREDVPSTPRKSLWSKSNLLPTSYTLIEAGESHHV